MKLNIRVFLLIFWSCNVVFIFVGFSNNLNLVVSYHFGKLEHHEEDNSKTYKI
jgi:hypothetical protein